MSDRERWTIYPLLLLTLLLHAKRALNQPIGNDVSCNLVRCNELLSNQETAANGSASAAHKSSRGRLSSMAVRNNSP